VLSMRYTHIELLPVMEHPLDESWGYQIINYYAPTSRFGRPEDFMYFVDTCHQNGIGVILDWVPGHFPRDGHGLANFDGQQIYAYPNWKKGEHKEWGTYVFDFGRREVSNFLISNANFWLDKYHMDGLRVDAVASMLYLDYDRKPGEWEANVFGGHENLEAIDFLKKLNTVVHADHPGIVMIAEESTSWPRVTVPVSYEGLGFDMKWNMGWMHDTLDYFSKEPIYRKYHQGQLTFSLVYAFSENFILPVSHDEVVYGKHSLLSKMPGDDWQKFANTRLFLSYMFAHPGKKLSFMTNDIGQWKEWDSRSSLDWWLLDQPMNQKLHLFVKDIQLLYKKYPAFYQQDFNVHGFEWIDFSDIDQSVISFLRWSKDYKDPLIFTFNMTSVPRHNYRIGVPYEGFYEEVLNSDAVEYGGSGVGNLGGVAYDNIACHGRPYSLNLNLPPLGASIFHWKEGK
jgi:1,4-alpha-glucan branching enzyme